MTEVEITPKADEHLEDVLVVEAVAHRRNVYDRHLPP